jgi:hypothetical protein
MLPPAVKLIAPPFPALEVKAEEKEYEDSCPVVILPPAMRVSAPPFPALPLVTPEILEKDNRLPVLISPRESIVIEPPLRVGKFVLVSIL